MKVKKRDGGKIVDILTKDNKAICVCECGHVWTEGDRYIGRGGKACRKCCEYIKPTKNKKYKEYNPDIGDCPASFL